MLTEYIGFAGQGYTIEFILVGQTPRAYQVECEDGVKIWLPKSVFEDDGSLSDLGCSIFHTNYAKAIGEYK